MVQRMGEDALDIRHTVVFARLNVVKSRTNQIVDFGEIDIWLVQKRFPVDIC
jgi:hypothetical protein